MDKNYEVEDGKTAALISYITWLGFIIALIMNNSKKNSFTAFHIRQSLGLILSGLGLCALSEIPFIGTIIFLVGVLFVFYLWVVGLVNAIKGTFTPVPVLGEKFEEWFKSID